MKGEVRHLLFIIVGTNEVQILYKWINHQGLGYLIFFF